jgi:membrane protein
MASGKMPVDAPAGAQLERRRLRAAAFEARAQRITARAAEERSRHGWIDALFETVDRDAEVGGGIIAGALAYRLFIWLLPFALVAVAGLGFAADATSTTATGAADSLGVAGLVSTSVASAAKSSSRWYALLVGVPILFWATRSLLRALIGVHRLVWTDLRAAAPRPTIGATARLLGLILSLMLLSAVAGAARSWSVAAGVLASLILVVPYAGLWLLVSTRLPHRAVGWRELVPGAVLFGIGVDLLQIAAAYVLGPMALNKQGTYGALGIAAALLLGLYLLGRAIVTAAALNATLAERRGRSRALLEGSNGG